MKINVPKNKFIFIELTREDMQKMDITCDKLDYSDPKTREVIDSLLVEAKRSLGHSFDLPDKIKVDALPSLDGGCLLFFTVIRKPIRYKLKNKTVQLCFEFEKQEDVFDLAGILSAEETNSTKSSLYIHGDRTILFISGRLRHSLVARINEYATPIKPDSYTCAVIKEYGVCLGGDNALKVFGGRLSQ